jgi:hypothetical protein
MRRRPRTLYDNRNVAYECEFARAGRGRCSAQEREGLLFWKKRSKKLLFVGFGMTAANAFFFD